MSQILAVPRRYSTPARPWLLGAAFLFLGAVFYLAEPLNVTMSTSDFINLEENDVTTIDRVETNIQANEEGNTGRQIGVAGLAVLGAVLIASPSQSRLRLGGLLALAALFFLAWSAASVFWSEIPLVTVRKLIVLGSLCLGAVGLAKWLSLREMMLFTLSCTGLLLAAGVAAECALGTFKPWIGAYRFSGLTWPAFSAWNASLFVLAAVALRRTAGRFRIALGAAALAAVGLLLLTKTRASAGALLAAGLVYVGFTWSARRQLIVAVLVCVACSLGLLAAELSGGKPLDGLIDAVNLGRTETAGDISGRAGLWRDVGPYVAERPLTGYGYESFWTPRRLLAVGEDNWGAPDAHNSFINLTLGVGVVGTTAYSLVLLLCLWRARTGYRATSDIGYVFCCCAIVVLIGNALFVSTCLAPALYSFITMALLARLGFVAPTETPRGTPT